MKFAAVVAGVVLGCLLMVGVGRAHNRPGTAHNREHAIVHAFCGTLKPCPLGREAVRVARCESGPNLWPYATNGQYLGMFQFGLYARSVFGFSWSPWQQARAAFRYFVRAGWSPWECRP